MCSLASSYQYSVRKLTVSYSDTFKRLINVLRYTSSSHGICNERNGPNQCGAQQIFLQLDEQSNSFPPTIVLLPLQIVMHISSLH